MLRSLILFFFLQAVRAIGQDLPLYSLYMLNGLVVNPAYAGSQSTTSFLLHYRNQWAGFDNQPQTFTAAFDTPFANERFNIGGIFMVDQFALTRKTTYNQCFSFKIPITESSSIALGAQAGLSNLRLNLSEFEDSDDPAFVNNYSQWVGLAGLGLYYQNRNWYTGVSTPYIELPRKELYKGIFPTNYKVAYITAGGKVQLFPNVVALPSLLFKHQAGYPEQLDISSMVRFKQMFSIGATYRPNSATVMMADFTYKQFKLAYAYDHYLNGLKTYSKGAHELMVKYDLKYLVNVIDPKTFH